MLYADDTTVSFASIEISALFQVVTEDLKLISEWLKHNRLKIFNVCLESSNTWL